MVACVALHGIKLRDRRKMPRIADVVVNGSRVERFSPQP